MARIKKSPHTIRESVVERIAYKYLFERKSKAAVDLFKLNLALFPESSTGYYNLAEAYSSMGNTHLAIENYTRYLALEPEDRQAKQKLAKIRTP
jgi:predicted TPR repeat methyltransferase